MYHDSSQTCPSQLLWASQLSATAHYTDLLVPTVPSLDRLSHVHLAEARTKHTNSSVLQLVEAKLRRAYQEGQAARLAGQDPLAAELAALVHKPKTHAAAVAQAIAPEDDHHTPADPTPPPQSPPRAASGVSPQIGDVGRVDGGLTLEEQLSIAQADANMAALLKEEAGSAHLLTASLFKKCPFA